MVQFFELSTNAYLLNGCLEFEIFLQGFVWRVKSELIPVEVKIFLLYILKYT